MPRLFELGIVDRYEVPPESQFLLVRDDVAVIEAAASEVSRKLRGRLELWRQIKQDGIVVFGAGIDALAERADDDVVRS